MGRGRTILLTSFLAVVFALVPTSSPAMSLPATLAANRTVGALHGTSAPVRSAFPIGYLGVSWRTGSDPLVRFRTAGAWGAWQRAGRDVRLPTDGGRAYSDLVPANDATTYQLRGRDTAVRTVAINTTDGPRHVVWRTDAAPAAAAVSEPSVVSRAAWGANESYRFDSGGNEVWPPAFYKTQKLIVHHTAGQNDDPDPAATVRAIYYYHAVTRGYGDIGYNFLIDAQGRVYKGRWSGPANDRNQADDTATGENAQGDGVTAAHTAGWNSGTVGIAMLGTYSTVDVTPAARQSLVDMLAWESQQNGIDPQGSSTFTNPVSGAQKFEPNISGHRDWLATECPGDVLYGDLPSIRQQVAAELAGSTATVPGAPSLTAHTASRGVSLSWTTPSDGGSAITGYAIYRSRTAGSETLLATVGPVNAYTDPNVKRGRVFYYRVAARNAVGQGSLSNEAAAKSG